MSHKRKRDDDQNNSDASDVQYASSSPRVSRTKQSSSTGNNDNTKGASTSLKHHEQVSGPASPTVKLVEAIIPSLETLLNQLLITISECSDEDIACFSAKEGTAAQRWHDTQKLVTVFRQMCGLPAHGAITPELKASMEVTLSDAVVCRLDFLDRVFNIIDHETQPDVVRDAMHAQRLHGKRLLDGVSDGQHGATEAEDRTLSEAQGTPDCEGDEFGNDDAVDEDVSEARQHSVSRRSPDREPSSKQDLSINTPQPTQHTVHDSIKEATNNQKSNRSDQYAQDQAIAQFALETHIQLSNPSYANANMFAHQQQPGAQVTPAQATSSRSTQAAQSSHQVQSSTATETSNATNAANTAEIATPQQPPPASTSTLSQYRAALAHSTSTKPPPPPTSSSTSSTIPQSTRHPRTPWSTTEVNALMTGLDTVRGPYWSSILSMYGCNGSISQALASRNQVQLKDKARNLKMLFLKQGIDVPRYLRDVTGDLGRRVGTRAKVGKGLVRGREEQGEGDREGRREEMVELERARGDAIAALALEEGGGGAISEGDREATHERSRGLGAGDGGVVVGNSTDYDAS